MTSSELPPKLFTMPESVFHKVNLVVASQYGHGIGEIAETDPVAAYDALNTALTDVVQRGMTEKLLSKSFPPAGEIEQRQVVINVIKKRSLLATLRKQPPKISQAVSFMLPPRA